jgi:hypothetical protein
MSIEITEEMVISAINAWHGNRDPGGQYTAFSDNEGEAMRAALTAVAPLMQAEVADGYYIATFKHGTCGGHVTWWGPNDCGYTPDIDSAGIYPANKVKPGYHDNEYTVPIPVALVNRFRVRRMLDVGDTMNAPLQSAKALREWLAAAPEVQS